MVGVTGFEAATLNVPEVVGPSQGRFDATRVGLYLGRARPVTTIRTVIRGDGRVRASPLSMTVLYY